MTARWPSELPQRPIRDPYRRTLSTGRKSTSVDRGPTRSGRRYSNVGRPANMEFAVSTSQLTRFWRFIRDDIDGGTLPFWIRNPILDGQPLLTPSGTPVLTSSGRPVLITAWWLVMLDQQDPSETALGGGRYQISVPMVVMP